MEHILGHPLGPSPYADQAVTSIAAASNHQDWHCLGDIDIPICQRTLSQAIDEASYNQLLVDSPSIRSRLPHAGDWLNVVPSSTLGLNLRDREFGCCLRYWLGAPLHSKSFPCPECNTIADKYSDHHVGCLGNGDVLLLRIMFT